MIEMVKRVTVLINLFRRKSGVHPVMSPRQLMFGKKFKTPLCKICKLVMACNVTASNKTTHPRAFFALYIGPSDSGTSHIVFKLAIKRLVTTPKCKSKPMAEDIVTLVNEMGEREGMPGGIQFQNIHYESTLSDLYANEVCHNDNNIYASDDNWEDIKKPEPDVKLVADMDIDDDELEDINDLCNEDELHLNDGLADNKVIADKGF